MTTFFFVYLYQLVVFFSLLVYLRDGHKKSCRNSTLTAISLLDVLLAPPSCQLTNAGQPPTGKLLVPWWVRM